MKPACCISSFTLGNLLHLKCSWKLNQLKDKFKERVAQLEEELSSLEGMPCFNELSVTISESEISQAISKIKCNKAPGLDNISNYMIKYGQSALLPVFKRVFIACLSNSLYPNSWANGCIITLHKSGDPTDPKNYRGIYISSATGKLFNSILNNRLDSFLIKHKIIHDAR
jgi:hypothetical protein